MQDEIRKVHDETEMNQNKKASQSERGSSVSGDVAFDESLFLEGDEPEEEESSRLVAGSGDDGKRLDVFLAEKLDRSRSFVQGLLKDGRVFFSGKSAPKSSTRVTEGLEIFVSIPVTDLPVVEPEPVDFDVIHEDRSFIVINKPAGLVVHPSPGHWSGTLVHGLLYRFPEISAGRGVLRPGIVHRLDAMTSGLLVVAKNVKAHENLARAFKERAVSKEYLVLLWSRPKRPEGRIELPIGRDRRNRFRMAVSPSGKRAVTDYRVLWTRGGMSFVICRIHTGRTHQIRVHMKSIGCPVVGDQLYAPRRKKEFSSGRLFLHAWKLSFPHPETGKTVSFRSALPEDLREFLRHTLSSKWEKP
jgi:23S rRNA pseudouridine1911/1915/1917 synthase